MKHIPMLLAAVLLLPASLNAAIINVGTHNVQEGDSAYELQIFVTPEVGDHAVSDMVLNATIADGGVATGVGTPGPIFTGADYSGTFWSGITFIPAGGVVGGAPQVFQGGGNGQNSVDTVAADGLLVTFIVDTTGFIAGESFEVRLSDMVASIQNTRLYYNDNGSDVNIPLSFVHGMINIVPEPASLALMAGGALLVFRRRRG